MVGEVVGRSQGPGEKEPGQRDTRGPCCMPHQCRAVALGEVGTAQPLGFQKEGSVQPRGPAQLHILLLPGLFPAGASGWGPGGGSPLPSPLSRKRIASRRSPVLLRILHSGPTVESQLSIRGLGFGARRDLPGSQV